MKHLIVLGCLLMLAPPVYAVTRPSTSHTESVARKACLERAREEVVEAAFVAAAVRSGASATHGAMALKFFDK